MREALPATASLPRDSRRPAPWTLRTSPAAPHRPCACWVRVPACGINPGVRSALTNHHFAGPSNRFWKLLFDSGLVPERITYVDDHRLPEWGLGVTNLIPRPTPGIDTLRRDEDKDGLAQLRMKVRRWKPTVVAFVGVTCTGSCSRNDRRCPCPSAFSRSCSGIDGVRPAESEWTQREFQL